MGNVVLMTTEAPAETSVESETIIDYPWFVVVQTQRAEGVVFGVFFTQDADADDWQAFDAACPGAKLLEASAWAHLYAPS